MMEWVREVEGLDSNSRAWTVETSPSRQYESPILGRMHLRKAWHQN